MSIRYKLTLWYSVILAAVLVVGCFAIYFYFNYTTYNDVEKRINEQIAGVNQDLQRFSGRVSDPSQLIQFIINSNYVSFKDEFYIQFYNYTNKQFKISNNLQLHNLQFPFPETEKKAAASKPGYKDIKLGDYSFYVFQTPITIANTGEVIGYLQVGAYTSREKALLHELRTILVFASLITLLFAFTIGLIMARQSLRPIETVIEAAKRIETGTDLSMRITRQGPNDELGRLTDTLNSMLERLEGAYNELGEAYEAQRRFVSDASHELRTPLTTIRGNIDLLQRVWLPALLESNEGAEQLSPQDAERLQMSREAMGDISDEAKRMTRLVNDLLALARADAGYNMEKEAVELLPLVEEVARRAQLLPRKAEWRVGDLSALESVGLHAHPDFLRQLLFIFIENAFKYTPEGVVDLQAIRNDNQVGLMIRDTGIGMNAAEVPHIFDRFYRADESRGKTGGTGLGLSIAKWIIDEHKGSVEVRTQEGMGTTFMIWLPIAFSLHNDSVIIETESRNTDI